MAFGFQNDATSMVLFTLTIIIFIGLIIISMYRIGRNLPEEHTATQTRVFATSPEELWSIITNYPEYEKWRYQLKSVKILAEKDGYQTWQEVNLRNKTITYIEIEKQAPVRLVAQIDDTGMPFGGQWIYELTPEESGTRLTITEDGKIYNPIFRFIAHYFMDETQSMRDYLLALNAYLT